LLQLEVSSRLVVELEADLSSLFPPSLSSDYAKSGVNQSTGDGKVHNPNAAKTFTIEEDF